MQALQRSAGNGATVLAVQRHCFTGHADPPVKIDPDYPKVTNLVSLRTALSNLFRAGQADRAYSLIIAYNRSRPNATTRFNLDKHAGDVEGFIPPGVEAAKVIAETVSAGVPQYLTGADVRPGDLVYGLSVPRDRYVQSIANLKVLSHTIVDELNHQFLGVRKGEKYPHKIGGNEMLDLRIKPESKGEAERFRGFLEISSKPPGSTPGGTPSEVNARLRRASKQGIPFTATGGRVIRFVLDEIDMGVVTRKRHKDDVDAPTGKVRAITGSELRFLYRNRSQPWMSQVQFFLMGSPVAAPWLDVKPWSDPRYGLRSTYDLWTAYVPGSVARTQGSPFGVLPPLPSASQQIGPSRALEGPVHGPVMPTARERGAGMRTLHLDTLAVLIESGKIFQQDQDSLAMNISSLRDLHESLGTTAEFARLRAQVASTLQALIDLARSHRQ